MEVRLSPQYAAQLIAQALTDFDRIPEGDYEVEFLTMAEEDKEGEPTGKAVLVSVIVRSKELRGKMSRTAVFGVVEVRGEDDPNLEFKIGPKWGQGVRDGLYSMMVWDVDRAEEISPGITERARKRAQRLCDILTRYARMEGLDEEFFYRGEP